ncbi:hypothetical protein DPMN_077073 [Dreissena polymorpha]|uniref:Uncharacterized protein n=1 Tax=Dreissena polymorpha TaxID=45954 RepID=A0A9D3YK90_DREPO|nr:hypothetical protein DPMN_077073 [Dreissena polymorpha]
MKVTPSQMITRVPSASARTGTSRARTQTAPIRIATTASRRRESVARNASKDVK